MKKTSKALASTAALCLVLSTSSVFAAENTAVAPERLSGANRVDTAVKIAEKSFNEAWKGQGNAILSAAADANLVDSLAVAPLSYQLKAPILLNDAKDSINADTLKALKANNVKTVYIATGEGVISNKAKAQLEKEGFKVERLGGKNRYETAKNILDTFKKNGGDTKNVALVSGNGLADALSVAPEAARKGMPILLTDGKDAVAANLAEVAKAADTVYAIGGNGIISDALVQQLKADRVSGHSRYETNAAVIKKFAGDKEFSKIYLGNGQDGHLVDSLTGSVLAAQSGSPIVLADKNLADATKDALKGKVSDQTGVVALGGEAVVSDNLVKEVTNIANESPEYVAADKAVKAYEDAKITTAGEITAAKALKAPAEKAVELVKDQAQKDALKARIAAKDKAISEAEAKLALKVDSVSAINAKELQVKFNQPVDEDSVLDTANYVISINGTKYETKAEVDGILDTAASNAVSFNETTNVVTFRLKDTFVAGKNVLANGDKYSIDVRDGVLSKDKSKQVVRYTDTQKTFSDTTAPKLVKTEMTSDKKLKLTFDEPVVSGLTATVDGVEVSLATPSTKILDYTVESSAALSETLRSTGNHAVSVYNATDLATPNANKATILTGSFNVVADTVAPTVKEIKTVKGNDRSFDIIFSEPLKSFDDSKLVVKKGNYTFGKTTDGIANNGSTTYKVDYAELNSDGTIGTPGAFTTGTSQVVRVTFGQDDATPINPLFGKDENSVNLAVEVDNYKDTADLTGGKYNGSVNLNKDLVAPKVSSQYENKITGTLNTANGTDGKLVVKFDKTLVAGTVDVNKVTITDKDGITRTVASAAVSNESTNGIVTMDLTQLTDRDDMEAKAPFTVNFAADAVKANNKVGNTALTTTILPSSNIATPVVEAVTSAVSSGTIANVVTITYNKEMTASASNLANYTLDNAAFPQGTTISMSGDNKIVTIKLPEGYTNTDISKLLTISKNVKTKSGSSVVGSVATKEEYTKMLAFKDNTKPTLAEAKYLVNDVEKDVQTKKIKLTFSEDLAVVANDPNSKNDLKVVVNGATQTITAIDDGKVGDKVITITLDKEVNVSQAATISVVPEADQDDATTTNNVISITDKATNKAKEGSKVVTNGKELDSAAIIEDAAAQNAVNAQAGKITQTGIQGAGLNTGDNVLTKAQALVDPGYTVTLESSDNIAINASGVVTKPANTENNATGSVTFKVTKDGKFKEVTVDILVEKEI